MEQLFSERRFVELIVSLNLMLKCLNARICVLYRINNYVWHTLCSLKDSEPAVWYSRNSRGPKEVPPKLFPEESMVLQISVFAGMAKKEAAPKSKKGMTKVKNWH
jgi:hypothetical protein